ncbi:hypothetical protein COOONC_26158 [Cooperia oncophora]
MAEFGLREEDLRDLPTEPVPVKPTSYATHQSRHLYALTDVYHKAIQVHGSPAALDAHRRPLIAMRKELTDAERMRMRMRVETTTSTSKGADRVVAIAFTLNVCDAAFKYTAAYLTGSKSLFAEAIHSTMDTCNQMILLMGIRYSARNPDNLFPYGYGKDVKFLDLSYRMGCRARRSQRQGCLLSPDVGSGVTILPLTV